MAVPFLRNFIFMEDAGAYNILVLFRVTTPDSTWTVRFSEFLAVPDKAPNNCIQDMGIGIEHPAMVICLPGNPIADLRLEDEDLLPGIAGNMERFSSLHHST